MKKTKILKDECLTAVMRNELLRQQISEALNIPKIGSVRVLAKRALQKQDRNKIYDAESLELIKTFMGFDSINEMYKD